MKNKKVNIVLLVFSLLLLFSIKTLTIGVNDSTSFVSRQEFESRLNYLETELLALERSLPALIVDYFTSTPVMFEAGNKINITLNPHNNKYTISYYAPSVAVNLTTDNTSLWNTIVLTGTVTDNTLKIDDNTNLITLKSTATNPLLQLTVTPSPNFAAGTTTSSGCSISVRGQGSFTPVIKLSGGNIFNITIPAGSLAAGTNIDLTFISYTCTW
ncbi:MAG: hypothetical protein Q4F88_06785 [Eubacteriales bacterium]|nr:hypothetical protein [Eubacteriales bacterium]